MWSHFFSLFCFFFFPLMSSCYLRNIITFQFKFPVCQAEFCIFFIIAQRMRPSTGHRVPGALQTKGQQINDK